MASDLYTTEPPHAEQWSGWLRPSGRPRGWVRVCAAATESLCMKLLLEHVPDFDGPVDRIALPWGRNPNREVRPR